MSAGFPKEDTYGLALQMRRAAVSVPANIAEDCIASTWESGQSAIYEYDRGITGRSQPLTQRLCVRRSGFGLQTADFHIPHGYQGRSPV